MSMKHMQEALCFYKNICNNIAVVAKMTILSTVTFKNP